MFHRGSANTKTAGSWITFQFSYSSFNSCKSASCRVYVWCIKLLSCLNAAAASYCRFAGTAVYVASMISPSFMTPSSIEDCVSHGVQARSCCSSHAWSLDRPSCTSPIAEARSQRLGHCIYELTTTLFALDGATFCVCCSADCGFPSSFNLITFDAGEGSRSTPSGHYYRQNLKQL